MYMAVFQVVLLYVRKIWVVMDAIMTVIEGFHHRIYKQISGVKEKKFNGW